MKSTSSLLLAASLAACAPIFAQSAPDSAPPPPPPIAKTSPASSMQPRGLAAVQGPSSNRSSRVEGIDYAPDGSIRSVYLRDGAFIHLSPDLGRQSGEFVHKGVKLAATGVAQTFARQTTLEANSITVAGHTFVAPTPPAGAQLAGGTPPPMPGVGAPRPGFERGPVGPIAPGPMLPPPMRGPRSGGPAAPPPPPPPPDASRLNGDQNARPGGAQLSNPVPPPPSAVKSAAPQPPQPPQRSQRPQPGATPVPPSATVAPAPQR